jgi:hypothetical protein
MDVIDILRAQAPLLRVRVARPDKGSLLVDVAVFVVHLDRLDLEPGMTCPRR